MKKIDFGLPICKKFRACVDLKVSKLLDQKNPTKYRSPKIFRDAVFGFHRFRPYEINIIDNPLFQRLRYINQTSLALFVYPSSSHSRFEHSISCASLTTKYADAIHQQTPDVLTPIEESELRLAGLLHDVGHGPFSHASEDFYGTNKIFAKLRQEYLELFGNPENSASEIFSFFIVTSPSFKKFFDKIRDIYKTDPKYGKILQRINLHKVGLLILAKLHRFTDPRYLYLDQIINGPFDVDKMDYIHRDGYFTGLDTTIDLERFFQTVHVASLIPGKDKRLAIDVSGVTAVEQLVFSKMLMFSVVYHHHKVRAAALALRQFFQKLSEGKWKIKGLSFKQPFDFLEINDHDVLNQIHKDKSLQEFVTDLRNRNLPRAAVVISFRTVKDEDSRQTFLELPEVPGTLAKMKADIVRETKVDADKIYIDIPSVPRFRAITQHGFVRISPGELVPLETIYPTSGWAAAYIQNRYKAYIFGPRGEMENIAIASKRVLEKYGIRLHRHAFDLAKHDELFTKKVFKL